eukprot:g57099.t1
MCGNFGLICFCTSSVDAVCSNKEKGKLKREPSYQFDSNFLDAAVMKNVDAVERNHGGRSSTGIKLDNNLATLPVLTILEAQTRSTQVRGGQAGGYSTMEYPADFRKQLNPFIRWKRVRLVALKRTQFSQDLAAHYHKSGGRNPSPDSVFTAIGHTRFATASANKEQELHPHEWVAFHEEPVWKFDETEGHFVRAYRLVGLHLSHNGDFERFRAYGQEMVTKDCGLWLERILHCSNPSRGDSAKIAGMMDLFRVMGRWGPAARLAWVRTVFTGVTDSCGGHQLSETAPNTCPPNSYWQSWGHFIERVFAQHVNQVIISVAPEKKKKGERLYRYYVDPNGEKALVEALVEELSSNHNARVSLNVADWTNAKARSFFYQTVRDFLRMDLYSSLTEFLGRASGSFGLQSHCTIEPGVVVIASKGQPMCMSYDPELHNGLVLFGSEGDAMAVPVQASGGWLSHRIDLNPKGEVVRLGLPRALIVGGYTNMQARAGLPSCKREEKRLTKKEHTYNESDDLYLAMENSLADELFERNLIDSDNLNKISLLSGLEIRSYSLLSCQENDAASFFARAVPIYSSPETHPAGYDLVGADLSVVPGVLSTINEMWATETSLERKAAQEFGEHLVTCMQKRVEHDRDSIDLLIGGIEASLWVAEQWAADLRTVFPFLNITTTSANKLLDLSCMAPGKVYFPGVDRILKRRINNQTCVLLISQSGQTFGTLHATTQMLRAVQDRLWLLTGCFSSQMEQTMRAYYLEHNIEYYGDRVFTNFSGSRPAEPTSVAIAATWHTLTHLMMQLIRIVREKLPNGRLIHDWDKQSQQSKAKIQLTPKKNLSNNANSVKASSRATTPAAPSPQVSGNSATTAVTQGNSAAVTQGNSAAVTQGNSAAVTQGNSAAVTPAPPARELTQAGPALDFPHAADAVMTLSVRSGVHIADRKEVLLARASRPDSPLKPLKRNFSMSNLQEDDKPLEDVGFLEMPTLMMLSDGCIEDMKDLLDTTVIPAMSSIVGCDTEGKVLEKTGKASDSVHRRLVEQGQRWGAHINEPWNILVLAAVYIILSVALGMPLFKMLAMILLPILQSQGVVGPEETVQGFFGQLSFSVFLLPFSTGPHIGYILAGLILQTLDAVWYVFIGKILVWVCRYYSGRPMWARMGKRTIIIIDTPVNHQLLENFVSKLFSQSYSVCCPDVHGSSGLDHFVHRFTHRVCRGVLLAVGRPDGRLCNLARSESAVLLGVKQAAFIRNNKYPGESSGPETVTIGHNDYQPNVGLAHHIVIHSQRRKFLDEYVYEQLYASAKPYTGALLRLLRLANRNLRPRNGMNGSSKGGTSYEADPILELLRQGDAMAMPSSTTADAPKEMKDEGADINTPIVYHVSSSREHTFEKPKNRKEKAAGTFQTLLAGNSEDGKGHATSELSLRKGKAARSSHDNEILEVDQPYSTHHIEPDVELAAQAAVEAMQAGQSLVAYLMDHAKKLKREVLIATEGLKQGAGKISNDPDERLAWASRLDARTLHIQDSQVIVQQFYESRIASLERYIAFCVMFHAMAKACHKPWFRPEWDIAKSQSNLRVATTASPIGAAHSHAAPSYYELQTSRQLLTRLRHGATAYF